MKSIVKSLCVLMLGLMATTIQAQSPTPIANLDFEITSSTTTMPANYVYSASNTPNLKTQNGIKCIIISDGGGSTAPTFNGSSAPTNGKRWMAFCPDVDCEVTIGIMSNKKKFFIQSKDGEFFSHTNTANAVEEKTVTGLKAGQWYAMCGGSSQVYITKMAFKVSAPAGPVAVTGVTLDKTSASVEAGQTLQLTATVSPTNADNKNVSWTSNNPTVANVDQNGLVTAYSAGNATITVTTEDGSKTATCTVTVTEPAAPVAVTGVSLNKSTTSIYVGASETLTATVAPADATNKAVTWSSNNTSVASVNNGVVTGVAIGQATITAKTVDGNFTATCAVTVETAPIINVTGVTLNKTSLELQVGKNETLTATVAPSNAANKNVTWSSSNSGVASVSNGLVTAIAAGTATITVTTEDGNKTATCSVTVTSGPPVPVSGLTTHVPEIYNARSKDGGYATPLVTYDNREYELYYASRTASSVASLPTTAGDKKDGIEDPATATSNYLKTFDGWCEAKMNSISGGTSAKASKSGEFSELYDEWRMSGNGIKIDIDGFDQFSYYAADKSTEINSKTGTFKKEQRFQVFIDGVMEPETQCNTSATVRRYDISSGHHVIEVKGMSGGDSKFFGFSLRVAQVPRTKYLKGNDSTQVIMQTTAPKPVYYYTKYNNMGETKLIWDGPTATGITLATHSSDALGDSLVLSGKANCPVGTYNYRVVSMMGGQETSSVSGKFSVASEIRALTATKAEAYQNEAIDAIRFSYYALSPNDVKLTWENNKQPAGISGSGADGIYTITGTPTQTGEFIYTISVTGGNSISDTIFVKELNLGDNPILYLYKNDKAYEKDGIFKYLTSNEGSKRNLIARKAQNTGLRPADQYAKYKWILISEDVDADNPEALALARGEGGLPVLSMKSFSYTPGRLDWGEPDNGSLTDEGRFITVWRADHPILKAFNKKQGERIQVLDTVVGKGLMPIDVNYSGTLCLATALTRDIDNYYSDGPERTFLHEVPAEMHKGQKYICLPIGAEGSNRLTADGKKLVNEAINYILSSQPTITLPSLAITDFKIGSYKGKIDDAENLITIDVLEKDSNAMKTAQPQIQLASPLTFVTPNSGETVDFSNWHFGVDFIVSDYINKRKYNVIVRLYNPQGIENIEAGTWVNIYDIYGRKVATTNEDLRTMELPHGMYIIVTDDGQTIKIMK